MKYAILIDAGFLKRKLGSQVAPLDINGVGAFLDALHTHEALTGMSLHRVYWYDAPPGHKTAAGGKGGFWCDLLSAHKCATAG